jgi:hypothetical protein
VGERQWYLFMAGQRGRRALLRGMHFALFGLGPLLLMAAVLLVPRAFFWLPLLAPALIASIYVLVSLWMISADLSLDGEALHLHVLGPWQITIPLALSRTMLISSEPPPRHVRLALGVDWESVTTVHVAGIGWLKVLGRFYGAGAVPLFVVTPDHSSGDALIRRLKHGKHPLARHTTRRR